ncbi:MAG: CDP-glycerol:glycerophosphate glycerophosphotransferase [Acutalibacteraceae bacterium]
MNEKVTVAVAIHNAGESLTACLNSIKNQTLKEIEVIMVDAASTDETKAVMESFLTDSRFSYYYSESESISAARNLAIKKAKGKYIAFGDASVIFSSNLLEAMYETAKKEKAQLCVSPMASSDVYGKHEFASSKLLKKSKKTDKFDINLIWNPAVTNKLFLKSQIDENNIRFNSYGKAREAAFTIPFAMSCDTIVSSSAGVASYIIPVINEGVSPFPIEDYLTGYEYIISEAKKAFDLAIEKEQTDFGRKELSKLSVCYLDQVYHKEITVLLYSYYRHFWSLNNEQIKKYADIIMELFSKLSKSGKSSLKKKNADIFYDGKLITSREEMAKNPKATVCIGKNDVRGRHYGDRLSMQVDSIFMQTMPTFELLVDSRLKEAFPEKWKHCENIRFIEAESLGDFKQGALEECKTDYIMFQDGFARLNPKILMRHFEALSKSTEKVGFTTSPLTRFDGKKTQEYPFSDLCFGSKMNQTRIKQGDTTFALDLFFCNKLFRTEHLRGIRFSFTDNNILDMYKLYEHCKFKKLSHRGAYLPYTEEEALAYLRGEENTMPSSCRRIYKKYKSVYFKNITLEKYKKKGISLLKKIKNVSVNYLLKYLTVFFTKSKLQNRVFFYSIRADGQLKENINCVYNAFDGNKVVFAKMLPHSFKDIIKIRRLMLTSKVIVTDDYMKYLRAVKLRPEQKVVQLWHAGGAFKRFGLDAPSRLTRLEEYRTHSQYSAVLVTSENVRQFYSHAFGVEMDVIKALGSPRTDAILNSTQVENSREVICGKHPLLKDKKVYVYLPTFREDGGVVTEFDPKIDWAKLNSDLADDEVFVVGRHPVMKKDFFSGKFYSRVKDYTADPTPELLAIADVIITDYSSVIFDASLLNKPMVFYCPDYGSYERDFYLDYDNDLPGEIVCDSEKLLSSLREALQGENKNKVEAFKQKQMGACDGKSTERAVALIKEYLNT